jgi:hypothetical protein
VRVKQVSGSGAGRANWPLQFPTDLVATLQAAKSAAAPPRKGFLLMELVGEALI